MKQSILLMVKSIFHGSEIVRRFTFKTVPAQDNYALLAVRNHQLADDSSVLRDKCAHFWGQIVLNAYHYLCPAARNTCGQLCDMAA